MILGDPNLSLKFESFATGVVRVNVNALAKQVGKVGFTRAKGVELIDFLVKELNIDVTELKGVISSE